MTQETQRELITIRERLISLRNDALGPNFDATLAVGLSHAVRALHFAIEGVEFEEQQ